MSLDKAMLMEFVASLGQETREAIATIIGPIKAEVAAVKAQNARLEAEVKELRQREYQGVWQEGRGYAKGAWVTRAGSMWVSRADDNRAVPGHDHTLWVLAVKAGKDARR